MPEIDGRTYVAIAGSDVSARDGMFLEVWDGEVQIIEVFYSDADGTMAFTAYREDLPLPIVEWAIVEGKARLVPSDKVS
jgi:hypothetical protein